MTALAQDRRPVIRKDQERRLAPCGCEVASTGFVSPCDWIVLRGNITDVRTHLDQARAAAWPERAAVT